MGCCNHLTTGLVTGAPNPMLHVNFVKGMVLGVDDYRQEFAYLSNGYQWAIRELIGYGTASGLAVKIEDDGEKGPRIQVSPGAAVPPSGRMICVGAPQCGWLNDWLVRPEIAEKVTSLLSAASPPDIGEIDVYLTLCFRDCEVLPVPIPGEPCRSDDELMTPSRIADDYVLSLSFDPPDQSEADAIARLVAFIDAVEVEEPLSPPLDEEESWRAALLAALGLDAETLSPPESSPPAVSSSPPEPLSVAEDHYDEFLRYVFRVWVTEIRPTVMARRCGTDSDERDDCLLLARLTVPVLREGAAPDRGWQVVGDKDDIIVDETRRPMIVPLHLVQTVLGMAVGSDEEFVSPPPGPPGPEGPEGQAATITVGAVSTLPPGSLATVANVGTPSAAILHFGIPQGQPGDTTAGTAATVTIGVVTALPPGSQPTVNNSGTPSAAVLDFGIPRGIDGSNGTDATIAIGNVTALAPGSQPTVGNSGTPAAAVFDFGIPSGANGSDGADATISVGSVTTLPAGSAATVANSGTPSAAVLNFGIPQGAQGASGGSSPLRLAPKFISRATRIKGEEPIDSIVTETDGRLTVTLPPVDHPDVLTGRFYIIRAFRGTAIVQPSENDQIETLPPTTGQFIIVEGRAEMLMAHFDREKDIRRWVGMADRLPRQG